MTFSLHVKFKSNERPWETNYEPVRPIADLEDAKKWAAGMAEGLGGMYETTLLYEGSPLQ